MIKTDLPIYLASKSPRRRKLLKQLNISFKSFSVDIDESIHPHETPVRCVRRLANEKMNKAKNKVGSGIIITADTIVVLKGKVIGKPSNKDEAVRFLKKLSNNVHAVYTGFSILNTGKNFHITDYEKTLVQFRKLSVDEIEYYVEGGSPMDKAGAYGIQDDFGAVFIKRINGCYYNVVGLPLTKLYLALKRVV